MPSFIPLSIAIVTIRIVLIWKEEYSDAAAQDLEHLWKSSNYITNFEQFLD